MYALAATADPRPGPKARLQLVLSDSLAKIEQAVAVGQISIGAQAAEDADGTNT